MTRLDRACVVVGMGAFVLAGLYALLLLATGQEQDTAASAWGIAGYLFARSVYLEHRLRKVEALLRQTALLSAVLGVESMTRHKP